MIINNNSELRYMYNLIVGINKKITGSEHQIINNNINSALSSSPYINDLLDDAVTMVYGIMMNHSFKDGNKRTAIALLVILSETYKFKIKSSDFELYKHSIDLVNHKITKDQFKELVISK